MKNGSLKQFLDTRWHMGDELYYQGYVYWCECVKDFDVGITTFTLEKWRADCDGKLYYSYIKEDGKLVNYEIVYVISGNDMDDIKRRFLTAPVFNGKSFWEVEHDLIWVDDSGSTIQQNA